MADNAEGSSDPQISFKVKAGGDSNKTHNITIAESATVLDLKTKLSEAEYEDIPVDRQRLIYSGRVMKNDDGLATYKIKPGNTIHLVKSAASNPAPPPASAASAPTPQAIPSNMAAGTPANNILAGLTGARFAGHAPLPNSSLFGPDGGMNIPSEDQLADMLSNPAVAASMNEALNNPNFVDFMIQQNPVLRDMPNAREMLQSPLFRQMMTNPEALRAATRMRGYFGGPGGGASPGAFPAPGATDTTPAGAPASGARDGAAQSPPALPPNPFSLFSALGNPPGSAPAGAGAGAAGAQNNPFLAMFGAPPPAAAGAAPTSPPPAAGTTAGASQTAAGQQQGQAAANPAASSVPQPAFGFGGSWGAQPPQMTPEAIQQLSQIFGTGPPPQAPPPDTRPPEERYADQLRQLNDMGFYDFDRNVAALRRSGGSVQGAVQHLLGD